MPIMLEGHPPERPEGQLTGRLKRTARRILRPNAGHIPTPTIDGINQAERVLEYEQLVDRQEGRSTTEEESVVEQLEGLKLRPEVKEEQRLHGDKERKTRWQARRRLGLKVAGTLLSLAIIATPTYLIGKCIADTNSPETIQKQKELERREKLEFENDHLLGLKPSTSSLEENWSINYPRKQFGVTYIESKDPEQRAKLNPSNYIRIIDPNLGTNEEVKTGISLSGWIDAYGKERILLSVQVGLNRYGDIFEQWVLRDSSHMDPDIDTRVVEFNRRRNPSGSVVNTKYLNFHVSNSNPRVYHPTLMARVENPK